MRESFPHAGRAGSPEVSSSNQSGGSASGSAGSLGVQDFMNPDILKTAKLWRFQKLSRGMLNMVQDSSRSPAASMRTNNKTRSQHKLESGAS
ncbi:hypothetical protein WJX77_002032 [Trebouxia sp. C0004]